MVVSFTRETENYPSIQAILEQLQKVLNEHKVPKNSTSLKMCPTFEMQFVLELCSCLRSQML